MEASSVLEQRATAVAKLKRAASLPRMKDGRRPRMHPEAVSEGERAQNEEVPDEESAVEPEGQPGASADGQDDEPVGAEAPSTVAGDEQTSTQTDGNAAEAPTPERPTTPAKKRRSRSRSRSRGSKDFRKQKPTVVTANTESSADEYYTSAAGEDVPPSPPLVSPIPSHFAAFQASRLLRSPLPTTSPIFYPGTTPSTPMLPTLDDISKGIGLFRSNSAGAARAMAMSKLTGEPVDLKFMSGSPTPPPGSALNRNNTVSGGERIAARRILFRQIDRRLKEVDGDVTSGGEESTTQITPKRRRRRSKRSSSRASVVLDDRDDRDKEPPSSSARNTPSVPPSPAIPLSRIVPDPPWSSQDHPSRAVTPYDAPMGGRGVLVEPEDEDGDHLSLPKPYPNLPSTPVRHPVGGRLPHTSDAPSSTSTDSAPASAVPVPVFISSRDAVYKDAFPASPFATPLKERPYGDGDDEEEGDACAEIRARMRTPITQNAFERDSEISWVADPVPRMPINDDEDDEDENEDEVPQPEYDTGVQDQADEFIPEPDTSQEYDNSNDMSSASRDLVVESETSRDIPTPLSFSSPTSEQPVNVSQPSPNVYPMRLSVATPTHMERSPSNSEFPELNDERVESTPKRGGEGTSTWERVKNTFTRSNSSTGRRSRTNSLSARDRRYNTDSSVSRESGASLNSAKVEKPDNGVFAQQQAQSPLMQSPSASGSILSLAPQANLPPGGVSPVPPASSDNFAIYQDPKLNPFPGIKHLEEQRNRAKGISASTPDIVLGLNGHANGIEAVPSSGSSSSATTRSPEVTRERKLSHQASDSRLVSKFNTFNTPQPLSSAPSSASHADYFSVQPASTPTPTPGGSSGSLKLPVNREGVKKWLSARGFFSSQSPAPSAPTTPQVVEPKPRIAIKKPSLSDLLTRRKDMELTAEWEEVGSDKSRTPTSANSSAQYNRFYKDSSITPQLQIEQHVSHALNGDAPQSAIGSNQDQDPQSIHYAHVVSDFSGMPSPPEPPSSTTPDPQSSLDDYPAHSTSESYSSTSSRQSPDGPTHDPPRAALVMERLDEVLGRSSKSSFSSPVDDPPRKLLLSSPVLQVANANTVKDRFLFLFTDILVIAKPIIQDHDQMIDPMKPSPSDRKFLVKSVVPLRDLRFSADRDESRTKTSMANMAKHPLIRGFVHQFAKDPDHAVAAIFDKSKTRDDPVALGQLLFRLVDIDRLWIGEYLSRRTSRATLKAYVDSFGFAGLRIDKALRVFLLSVCVPPKQSALEYLLDSFASRWYEANAKIVAYDKDLAIRLVRAIVQLNEVMHGGIAQTPGITGYPKRNVMNRDFIDAFRRFDARCLVGDDTLDKIYNSIRRERLSQARNPHNQTTLPEVPITIKRPLPPRLTYRVQSEPVILRIPQPDPQLTIQLFGQDLTFDPPILNFAKSSEASFRVTGSSLGPKTIIMLRSGPNALAYSGLPLSSPVVVERAFMRSTFQLAFVNQAGDKRKYMFSVNDSIVRHEWSASLKRQIDLACAEHGSTGQPSATAKAADVVAFRVLHDALIGPDLEERQRQASVEQAFSRLTSSADLYSPHHDRLGASIDQSQRRSGLHARSKSRSQVYHIHGAGKLEPEAGDISSDVDDRVDLSLPTRSDIRLWSGPELTALCIQNSVIPPLLEYLLGDSPITTAP
ncbi:hypothetical protein K474DRAFT_1672047 [Panus rudis PR-1116 ss-1]|nr:hypothetical protein K474DRAFT_1672047 [Panus rudis PR-1116 ss-1]